MNTQSPDAGRRRFCAAAMAACAAAVGAGVAPRVCAQGVRADHGIVDPPAALPAVAVRRADGETASLVGLLQGHATALHLMFTGCSTVCPIQGAIFERVQALLPDQLERGIQLLSLSVDPLADTPDAMRAWLRRFGAGAGWIAVAPDVNDLRACLNFFGQGGNALENHATQVNIIDRGGKLVFRTQELPSADSIANLLRKV